MDSEVPEAVVRYGERYGNLMLNPVRGERTCEVCMTFCGPGFDRCYRCERTSTSLAAVLPISYSVEGEQLHHALAGYKGRNIVVGDRKAELLRFDLAAVLWRFLASHERCALKAAGVDGFPLVTVVPSSRGVDPDRNPLERIVREHVRLTADRFERLLVRSETPLAAHVYDEGRFEAVRPLDGEPILLVEDTWTTGSQAQAAANAMIQAGSGPVSCVTIGRHISRGYEDNAELLDALPDVFDWKTCALHDN